VVTDDNIPAAILAQIYAQARAEFPRECCGYLVGRGPDTVRVQCTNYQDRLHAADPLENPRTGENGYNFGGRQLIDFTRAFGGPNPPTVIYHSHPRVGAYFSAEDERAALAAGLPVDYLVVDVQDDVIRESVLFRRAPEAATGSPAYVEVARFPGSLGLAGGA
jgi:[CysO sulfur-carrier protein]-S-L-cysteine hydrolase